MNIFSVEQKMRSFINVASSLESKLSVGMNVFLDANPGKSETQRYRATVQGWKRDGYLLLSISDAGGRPRIWESRNCVIRFIQDGEVSGFKTTCLRAIVARTDNLVQFQWPRDVSKVQVRRHQRTHLQTECRITLPDHVESKGQISDLSAGGCSLECDTLLDVGTVIRVTFGLPDGGRVCSRRVRVRSCQGLDSGSFAYGCQFEREHRMDHSIKMLVARKAAHRLGTPIPHHQLLVLARGESEFDLIQRSLIGAPVEVVASSGLLDLGARLAASNAGGIIISAEHAELEIGHVIQLLRNTPRCADMPLAVYGGASAQREAALAAGATVALKSLAQIEDFRKLLPGCQKAPMPKESEHGPKDTVTDAEANEPGPALSEALEAGDELELAPTGT